jgi:EAL domain-containing protein (putative c-di-GMP-specific phosphodiesterase class I)
LEDRRIVGAMVVVQMPGPSGQPLDGDDLRPIAEFAGRRFGLLDATLEGIARSGRPIPPAGIRLWFEVGAADVVAHGGAAALWERLSKVGLSGALLGVELVDPGDQDDVALAAAVAELRGHGVQVAVRVTGSGSVALATLARLAVDRVVIDPAVVEAVRADDPELRRAVHAVAGLASQLDAEVIATGVPSIDVAPLLRELGVGIAQVTITEPWAPSSPPRRPVGA